MDNKYTEEEIIAFKKTRNEISKFNKKFDKLIKSPSPIVAEAKDKLIKYWNNTAIKDRWIITLANNARSQFFVENNRYQPELEQKRKQNTITSQEMKEYVNKFTCNSAKNIDDPNKIKAMYMQVLSKAHDNKVNNKLNHDADEVFNKIINLI